jgi:hypothetical protein
MSTIRQSKLTAIIHTTDRIRVPFLPKAARITKRGVTRTTLPLKDRHLATQLHPYRPTSQGIVKNAIRHTTKKPEVESMAIHSTIVCHLGLSKCAVDWRNFFQTKKARNGGEKRKIRLTALNRGDKGHVYFE